MQIPVTEVGAASSASDFQLDSAGSTLLSYKGFAESVTVPGTVKTIGESAFEDKDTLVSVTLPDSVTKIEPYAFWGCDNLENIKLGSGVKDIGDYAFMNCTGLKNYIIPSTVTSIGIQSFSNCPNLTDITIPSSVTSIHESAFDGDPNLTIHYDAGSYAEGYAADFEQRKTENPEYEDVAGYSEDTSSSGVGNATEGTADSSEQSTSPTDVADATQATTDAAQTATDAAATQSTSNAAQTTSDATQTTSNATQSTSDITQTTSDAAQTVTGTVQTTTDPAQTPTGQAQTATDAAQTAANGAGTSAGGANSTSTSDNASQNNNLIGSTRIVGNHAVVFINNSEMNINSPGDSSTPVGEPGDDSDTLQPSASNSEKGGMLPKYTQVDYLGNFVIADQAFYDNQTLGSVTVPDQVKEIGQFSYARSSVRQISIPEGVEKIGYGAFYHCDDLLNVTLPASIQTVEPMAFTNSQWVDRFLSTGTEDYLITGGVLVAYRGKDTQITLPETVRVIAGEVFKGHKELRSVTLPSSLRVIGEGAFEDCTALDTVNMPEGVIQIKDRAFMGCPLTSISIPTSVTQLGLGAYDFTNTNKSTATKTVTFQGKSIPAISYETSAERLSNAAYRVYPLEDVYFAVIPTETTENDLGNTVLYNHMFPFQGIIGSISTDGFFVCRYTCIDKQDFDALSLPNTIQIGQTNYPISGLEGLEFLPWAANGSQSPGTVQVLGIDGASASIPGTLETLLLQAAPPQDSSAMETAYQRIYGASLPQNAVIYDMTLTDATNGLPITKLGTQEMTVTMPVPAALQGQTVGVLTLDRNGQLEMVDAQTLNTESGAQFTFTPSHFSLYAFYGKGSMGTATASANGSVNQNLGALDATPNTGDPIHPKWFLGGGLFFLSLILIFSKKGKKRKFKIVKS
jgi:hypothetical protein